MPLNKLDFPENPATIHPPGSGSLEQLREPELWSGRFLNSQSLATAGLRLFVRRTGDMAINHADGTLFVSVLFYPVAATAAAVSAGAKWFAPFFIPAGLVIGMLVTFFARRALYATMEQLFDGNGEYESGWRESTIGAALMLLYVIYPYAVIGVALYATWHGSIWVVKAATW